MKETTSKSKTQRKRFLPKDVLIHILSYIFVNALLTFINLVNGFPPQYLWVMWVVTGWGLGLIFHITSVLIEKTKWHSGTKFLIHHIVVYVVMSLYFLYIDSFTGLNFSDPINWAYFPISAWFALLFAHILSFLFIQARVDHENLKSSKRFHLFNAFVVHLFIFLCANAYLLIVNFVTGFENQWYLYPLGATTLALAIHLLVTILEILPIKNVQKKILLYHVGLYIFVSAYLIFDNFISGTIQWWFFPVGGWFLGILVHLIYYYSIQAGNRKK